MSGPLINRSLTTIRTELEFLHDSEVITDGLFEKVLNSLPQKYQKDMQPWGVEKLGVSADSGDLGGARASVASPVDDLSDQFKQTKIAPPIPAKKSGPKPLAYCKALYDYQAQENDDLSFRKDDKIATVEQLSEDWWKGYNKEEPGKVGVFPSNYVTAIGESDFESGSGNSDRPVPVPEHRSGQRSEHRPEKQEYTPPAYKPEESYSYPKPEESYSYPKPNEGYSYPPPQPYGQQYQPQSPQPYTPPFYQQPQPQPQQTVVEQSGEHSNNHLKKFGSKLGNAAIFGAGATIGSDIVNSIF